MESRLEQITWIRNQDLAQGDLFQVPAHKPFTLETKQLHTEYKWFIVMSTKPVIEIAEEDEKQSTWKKIQADKVSGKILVNTKWVSLADFSDGIQFKRSNSTITLSVNVKQENWTIGVVRIPFNMNS